MAVQEILKAGGVVLPSPISLTINDELIWSEETGRTLSGDMVGEIIAEKKNLSIKWGIMVEEDMLLIKRNMASNFFPFTFHDDGVDLTINAYRGTLSKEVLGSIGDGKFWYRSVTVDVIQR
ncbi:MAG: hypothetical protein MSA90_18525 [Faecalicatena sp.]|uniref:hypothetical protein n=1 Tax=Faecalicatena sp. TaxID=2005360 RepID=UPI00258CBCD5|nr:hypothetical protein [Faecalicatena sp.]MCI6467445.1 hypothetical protein [Faecalicatena sp.]MDY5618144.1 hypothetical protein [Lachnospiraceae bacterium]